MHSLKKLGTGGSAPAQPTTMGAARAFGPGRQPCGGGDCLVLSDSFLSFSANKKSTRRDSNPRPSPWQGDTPPLSHSCISSFILFFAYLQNHILNFRNLLKQPFWISPRPISDSQLRTLLHFHLCPIYLVVFKGSYFFRMGYLILRGASRLDAFSVYPVRTWLPGREPSGSTGAPAVRPSRSSRTKDSSSQISCAHAG